MQSTPRGTATTRKNAMHSGREVSSGILKFLNERPATEKGPLLEILSKVFTKP